MSTVMLTSVMIGVELSVSLFVNPAIFRRDARGMASDLAATLGRVMPVWYAVSLLLQIADAVVHRHEANRFSFVVAALVWLLTIVYTLTLLVPINNGLAKDTGAAGFDWKTQLRNWDLLHRWRIGFLFVAVGVFVWACR